MRKEFAPYEIALALKELGFDEPCFAHYCNGDMILKTAILKSSTMMYYQQNNINPNNQYKHQNCTAPLYQQCFRWFREKNIQSTIQEYDFNNYMYLIDDGINRDIEAMGYNTYEKAELECLKKLIEIVKNRDYENLFYTIDR
jgi:hypothetical protein